MLLRRELPHRRFYDGKKGIEPFTVTEKHGTWGTAQVFPAIITSNEGHFAEITSVSSILARNCTAVGFIFESETDGGVFAFSQKNGTWGPVKGIAGTLLPGRIGSLTCVSTGNCTAGGEDISDLNTEAPQPYIATEKQGAWSAQRLPGVAELSADTLSASLGRVICRSASNCTAVGTYGANSGEAVFVSTELNGSWGTAIELPGLAALNQGNKTGSPVMSCGAPGDCSLGGFTVPAALASPISPRSTTASGAKPTRSGESNLSTTAGLSDFSCSPTPVPAGIRPPGRASAPGNPAKPASRFNFRGEFSCHGEFSGIIRKSLRQAKTLRERGPGFRLAGQPPREVRDGRLGRVARASYLQVVQAAPEGNKYFATDLARI